MQSEDIFRLLVQKQIDGLTAEVQTIKSLLFSTIDANELKSRKIDLFRGQDEMRKVFLSCDGQLTNGEIAEQTNMRAPNVTRAIKKLLKNLLVYETRNLEGRRVFARVPVLEQIGLLEELEQL